MKKTLSLILCITMILSTVAFCFPAMATEFDFGVDTSEDFANTTVIPEATLAEEATLPISVDFEDGVNPFVDVYGADAGLVSLEVKNDAAGSRLRVTPNPDMLDIVPETYFRAAYTIGSLPVGRYAISFTAKADSTLNLNFYFQLGTDESNADITNYSIATTDTAVKYTFDVKKASTEAYLVSFGGAGAFEFDNFKVEAVPVEYDLVFNANGGKGVHAPVKKTTGTAVTLPETTTYTRDYYSFVGWGLTSGAKKEEVVTKVNPALKDLKNNAFTVYAIWERNTYDITFDFGEAFPNVDDVIKANEGEETEITLPVNSDAVYEGYMLTGWTGSNGVEYAAGEKVTVTEAVTFTAKWMDISAFETLMPVTASGYNGVNDGADISYPAAYYVFNEELDESTISMSAFTDSKISAYYYDATAKTLALFPSNNDVRPGKKISFTAMDTVIMNKAGTKLVSLPAVTYTLAKDVSDDGYNLFPYGDFEHGFQMLKAESSAITIGMEEEVLADGTVNHFFAARGATAGNNWPHVQTYGVKFEKGDVFKLKGRVKHLGHYGDPSTTTGSIMSCMHFSGLDGATDSYEGAGSNKFTAPNGQTWFHEHIEGLGGTREWQDFTTTLEITEYMVNNTMPNAVCFFSNPSGGKINNFALDDLELYKQIQVKYDAGLYCALKDGATAPASVGVFLDGASEPVSVTDNLAFAPVDARWRVDTAKPWIDQYGNTYAVGDSITITKPLVLTPNVVTDEKVVTVTFDGTGVTNAPAPVKLFEGDTLDMTKVEKGMKPTNPNMHFNGWSETGEFWDSLHGEQSFANDVTLKANVSYDIDFANLDNWGGWYVSLGEVKEFGYKGNMIVFGLKPGASSTDLYLANSNLRVPVREANEINIYVDPEYAAPGCTNKFTPGAIMEGIYFAKPGGSAAGGVLVKSVVANDLVNGYAEVTHKMLSHDSYVGIGTLGYFRWDPHTAYQGVAIRAIRFVGATPYEQADIQLTGLTAPATGEKPDTTATVVNGLGKVTSVEWTPTNFINGNFNAATTYTAKITVEADMRGGHFFGENTTATLDGVACDVKLINGGDAAEVTYTFEKTAPYIEFDMMIDGPDTILKAGRVTQYRVVFDSAEPLPDKNAVWSVNDEKIAEIDDGLLIPKANGTVWITATSTYNPTVSAMFEVTIDKQAAPGTVVYHTNTQSSVTNMPEAHDGLGITALSTMIPHRDGYEFGGWVSTPASLEAITSVNVPSNGVVNVYANWIKGIFYNFHNGNAGFGVNNPNTAHEDYLEVYTDYYDLIVSRGIPAVDGSKYTKMQVRLASDVGGGGVQIFYSGSKAKPVSEYHSVRASDVFTVNDGLDDWKTITFDMLQAPNWANGTIDYLRYDPINTANKTVRLDYLWLLDTTRTITFDGNGTGVTGIPASLTVNQGETVTIKEAPTLAGFEFMGWTTDRITFADLGKTFVVTDDMTLYAVWNRELLNNPVDEQEQRVIDLGPIDNDEVVYVEMDKPEATVIVRATNGTDKASGAFLVNANGKGYYPIGDFELPNITNVQIVYDLSLNCNYVAATEKAIADKLSEPKPIEETNTEIIVNGEEPGPAQYDRDVEDLTEEGKIGLNATDTNGKKSIVAEFDTDEPILLNFDEDHHVDFFNGAKRQMEIVGTKDSVLTVKSLGRKPGSSDSPALFVSGIPMNADSHRYIVVKAKSDLNPKKDLRIYYATEEEYFTEEKAVTNIMTDKYSMLVYDMASTGKWTGKIPEMFFSLNGNTKGTIDIDWILFTNEVPASMKDIAGFRETFPIVNEEPNAFKDVTKDDWFFNDVAEAYKLGFVNGMSEDTYNPKGNVTVAETITMAVRLNHQFFDKDVVNPAEGAEWYKPYVDAAISDRIITPNQFNDYTVPATRKEMVTILAKTVPSSWLKKINMFTELPDLAKSDRAFGPVIKFYNAGIIIGSDEAFTFRPESNVIRAEMAAIINRLALPENRKRVITQAEKEARKVVITAQDLLNKGELDNCTADTLKRSGKFAAGTGKKSARGSDPIVYFTNIIGDNFNGKDYSTITVRMMWDKESVAEPHSNIFFTTPNGGWAVERVIYSSWDGTVDENGVGTFVFDLKSNPQFADMITAIRFDPFDAPNYFAIESIVIE